jgi:arylsulfatase
MEGRSLVPAFAGRPIQRDAPLVWEHGGNRALRDGDWKIVARRSAGAWELYNLKEDRTELNNLADQYPERAAAMAEVWKKEAQRTRILPWPHGPLPE